MALSNAPVEKRISVRRAILGTIGGLFTDQRGNKLTVVGVDVSDSGIGLLIDPCPEPGTLIRWKINKLKIELNLIWCFGSHDYQHIPGMENMKRCGLICSNKKINLIQILEADPMIEVEEP